MMDKDSPPIDNQLFKDKQFLESVFQSVRDYICVINPDLTVRYANKFVQEWCKENAPLEGRKCFEVGQNRTAPCDNCPVIRCMASEKLEKAIIPGYPGSGVTFLEISAYPIKDDNTGEITGAVEIMHDITEQIQAEEQIRKQHSLIESLLDSSQDIIFFKDINGYYIGCNDEFAKHVGRRKEDIVGKTDYDIYTKEEADAFRENDRLMLKQNAPRHNEEWISYPDGKRLLIDTLKTPYHDPDGNLIGVLGISRDITERKKAEEELRKSEDRYRSLIDRSMDMIYLHDLQGNLLEVNQAVMKKMGYSREELLNLTVFDIHINRSDRSDLLQMWEKFAPGESKTVETEHRAKNGSVFPVEVSTGKIKIGDELYILALVRDITERKQAEEALLKSEKKVNSILNSLEDVVASFSIAEEKITYLSPSVEKIFGRKAADFIESKHTWTDCIHSDDMKTVYDVYDQTGGKDSNESEFRIIRPDGDIRWVRSCSKIIRNEKGKPERIDWLITDITERKQHEEERLEMQRQLLHSQKLESLGVLAGGIAHDFNNLLLAIIGNLDMSLVDLSPVSASRKYIEASMKAAERAADLTRQMLAYSGKGHFIVTDMNVNELINENFHILKTSVSKNVSLHLNFHPDIPPVSADISQIQQVVMNFITNASEAIGEAHGHIHISTGVMDCDEAYLKRSCVGEKPQPGKYVYVEVADTGCGMDEETKQKIFEPFFTTKFVGRGLGLAAVIGIIRGHKGAILVDSTLGDGTTIRVLFPVSKNAQLNLIEKAKTDSPENKTAAEKISDKTVLIVDDEEMVLGMCHEMVTKSGYQTLMAEHGMRAVEIYQDHRDKIDCVVLDLSMPKMGGYETFQELKKINPDVKVILSSGYEKEQATRQFEPGLLAGFIQKPYRFKELKSELERVLQT